MGLSDGSSNLRPFIVGGYVNQFRVRDLDEEPDRGTKVSLGEVRVNAYDIADAISTGIYTFLEKIASITPAPGTTLSEFPHVSYVANSLGKILYTEFAGVSKPEQCRSGPLEGN